MPIRNGFVREARENELNLHMKLNNGREYAANEKYVNMKCFRR